MNRVRFVSPIEKKVLADDDHDMRLW